MLGSRRHGSDKDNPGMSKAENTESSAGSLFPVSVKKLIVMSICTLGFYELYWMHANWVRLRYRELPSISPARRTLFALVYCYPLFRRMRDLSIQSGGRSFPATFLALGWVIASGAGRFLPAPYSLVALLGFVFLIPVQASVNRGGRFASDQARNSKLTLWNWLLVVPFGLMTALTIVSLMASR